HVAPAIFQSRLTPDGHEANGLLPLRAEYEASGGSFVQHSRPTELMPGVWFTGPVPRPYQERNWPKGLLLQGPDGPAEDSIPEDASVVVDTKDGLIIITGCGHAGVVNTAEYARSFLRSAPVHAVIGGLHLFAATDAQVAWTAGKLRELGGAYLLGAHCTGIEATYRLREIIGLTRKTAVVGAVLRVSPMISRRRYVASIPVQCAPNRYAPPSSRSLPAVQATCASVAANRWRPPITA